MVKLLFLLLNPPLTCPAEAGLPPWVQEGGRGKLFLYFKNFSFYFGDVAFFQHMLFIIKCSG